MTNMVCAVLGYGRMGKIHVSALVRMPNISKVIVIDSDLLKRNEALQVSRKVSVYSDLGNCLTHVDVLNYITISTPSEMHFEHLKLCMEFQLNILVEKPFVVDMNTASSLLLSCINYKPLIGVGFIERYNSSVRKAREMIAGGKIGAPLEIHTRRWGLMPPNPDVGVSLDLASHDVDICRFLLGHDYQEVFARIAGFTKKLESIAFVSGISKRGTVISNSVSWRNTSKLREVIVVGEFGSLKINTAISEVTLYQQSEPIVGYEGLKYIYGEKSIVATTIDHAKIEPIILEHLSFQAALVDGDINKIVSIQDASESLRVIDAIHRSAKANLPIIL